MTAPSPSMHCTHCCSPVSQQIKHTEALCTAAAPPTPPTPSCPPPLHCMLIFISALAAGAKEPTARLNGGLISQVKTLLIDIEYNYITRYAYPPTSY